MLEFRIRKVLLIKKMTTEKMGDLMLPHIHLARWTKWRVSKELGNRCAGVLMRQVLIGGSWNLALKGINAGSSRTTDHWLLKVFQCSSFVHVQILWFCEGGCCGETGFGCSWRPKFSPLLMRGGMAHSPVLLPLKNNLASQQTGLDHFELALQQQVKITHTHNKYQTCWTEKRIGIFLQWSIHYYPMTIEENALNNQREKYYNHLVNEGEK